MMAPTLRSGRQLPLAVFAVATLQLILGLLFSEQASAADKGESSPVTIIRHIPSQIEDDPRMDYLLGLLKLILSKVEGNYQLQPGPAMNQPRALKMLGRKIDVTWGVSNPDMEEDFRAVYLPIDKGLIGYRLPMVKAENINLFRNVKTLPQLRRHVAGQGRGWTDVRVLRYNGLPVRVANHYSGLFIMLDNKRFDYFPRGAGEILLELSQPSAANLAIENNLIIHYPACYFFFVAKDNASLAETLTLGFERAISDGSFEALFQQHFKSAVQILKSGRHIIELENPMISDRAPIDRKELWLDLGND